MFFVGSEFVDSIESQPLRSKRIPSLFELGSSSVSAGIWEVLGRDHRENPIRWFCLTENFEVSSRYAKGE